MERQNSKHVKQKKLEESARIRKLVDLAHKHDPTVQRQRNELKAKNKKTKGREEKTAREEIEIGKRTRRE